MKWRRQRDNRPEPTGGYENCQTAQMPATNRELSTAVHDLADAVRANAPRSTPLTIPADFIDAFRDGVQWRYDLHPMLAQIYYRFDLAESS